MSPTSPISPISLPDEYLERTYAGVLGKIIGVYLGRPFEQWSYERIAATLGEITYYVHERFGAPLILTDDDISGTFAFVRALSDYGSGRDLTAQQVGQTWLNYIIEKKTILWWGGLGNSTEHTAYLRLKNGIPAPHSGSAGLNTRTVAEQIGAQIFIDGWAMVAPGDPALAVELARRAASVSHDGEAIYGAMVVAAMESLAYIERDLNALIDGALSFIPRDCLIRRVIDDVREWHSEYRDWRDARQQIAALYGYERYGGNCHIIPNHALIHLALLYGGDDFHKAMTIVNTAGWDTDCNAGNVGCLLGIKNGLDGLEAGPDWRSPVADRLYVSSADGGSAISDALTEAYRLAEMAHSLAGTPFHAPKGGSKFHFEMPGSVQGFMEDAHAGASGRVRAENVRGHSRLGERALALHYHHLTAREGGHIATPTFIPPEAITLPGYELHASPRLYPGQTVRAGVQAHEHNLTQIVCRLYAQVYGAHDRLVKIGGAALTLSPGESGDLVWQIEETGGAPIANIGLELTSPSDQRADGIIYLDYLTWDGEPRAVFRRPDAPGSLWKRAWVSGLDQNESFSPPEAFRVIQNAGTGLLMQGCRDWRDYRVSAAITPHVIKAGGIGARVQGMERYYALVLCDDGQARLIKALDGRRVLAQAPFAWQPERAYNLQLDVQGAHLSASIDGKLMFSYDDSDQPLMSGGIALVVEEGRIATDSVSVSPLA